MKSKYNEKNINNIQKNLLSDKLFWCYYKLINNYVDKDIENINSFSIEKEEKIKLVEKIRNSKELFKKYKIRKNIVEGEIYFIKSIKWQISPIILPPPISLFCIHELLSKYPELIL